MVFPVVMYECERWTIKNAECQRTDAFELWCWRRLLRVPWITRRSNQSILKEINPEYSQEGLVLKLQYFGHLMWRADLTGKDSDSEKDWRQKEKGAAEDEMVRQHYWLNGHETKQTPGDSEGQGRKPGMLQFTGLQRVRHDWVTGLTDYLLILIIIVLKSSCAVIYFNFLFLANLWTPWDWGSGRTGWLAK